MRAKEAAIVLVTFSSVEEARRVVNILVEERLAACANLFPGVESVYRWRGMVETCAEVAGILKTSAGCLDRLQARFMELHSYEVPEFLVLSPDAASEAYLNWILSNVAG
jgi:periplasmic divalent cation tolerance protein